MDSSVLRYVYYIDLHIPYCLCMHNNFDIRRSSDSVDAPTTASHHCYSRAREDCCRRDLAVLYSNVDIAFYWGWKTWLSGWLLLLSIV